MKLHKIILISSNNRDFCDQNGNFIRKIKIQHLFLIYEYIK